MSAGYSDFLAHTLPHNKHHFDRLIVVTDTKDDSTKRLCEHLYVECIQTDVFYENGDSFAKAKGINVGLDALSKREWVIHLDADIYLPPMFRVILENIIDELPKDNIYGIDRMMCPDYNAWANYIDSPKPLHEGWIYVHPSIFPIGVRIAEYTHKGWEPIGFFQMWNPSASNVYTYPDKHGAADRTDVLFTKNWPRGKRQLIPEIIGIHIESENLDLKNMGKNWNGRKTKLFAHENTQELINIVDAVKDVKPVRITIPHRIAMFFGHLFRILLLNF